MGMLLYSDEDEYGYSCKEKMIFAIQSFFRYISPKDIMRRREINKVNKLRVKRMTDFFAEVDNRKEVSVTEIDHLLNGDKNA